MLINKTAVVDVEGFLINYFDVLGGYTISDDGVVDVYGDITLLYQKFNKDGFTELPIQFGNITGDFDFDKTNITTLKGFPHTVDGFCSVRSSKNLKSLEFSPQCNYFYCSGCDLLESLDFLNCNECYCSRLNLKRFGTNFSIKKFNFNTLPNPTSDEMRHLILLNPAFDNSASLFINNKVQEWLKILKDYHKHKDLFRVIGEFEELYGEPWVKPENRIEIINNEFLSF